MKMIHYLEDRERFPNLTEAGLRMLNRLREHEFAPNYNYACGDQLSIDGLTEVRNFEKELANKRAGWKPGEIPDWVLNFADRCLIDVPFYRSYKRTAENFLSLPAFSRKDLENQQWAFVPDSQSLDEMLVYYTSGTTGKSFDILSHPEVSTKYLPCLQFALARVGVKIEGGAERVFAVNVCAQNSTLTYATVSTYFDCAGYVKINLNPNDWKHPADIEKFINDLQPEIFTGDPIAFLALMKIPLQTKPKALVSSAMMLLPALKTKFENHFECPVIDVYSMNESRFIAASVDAKNYEIVPHDLFVEILDDEGNLCLPGVRGEITLTCGRNPFLPLLRYRTGDFAALNFDKAYPTLVQFEGRQPIMFLTADDRLINNIDVTQALEPFPIGQFSLHQCEDRSLIFKIRGGWGDEAEIKKALLNLFGENQHLTIKELVGDETINGKVLQYSTEIKDATLNHSEIVFR
ncbi:MAG: hypothetical protein AB1757_15650 [Acidobacteriota bacterium]